MKKTYHTYKKSGVNIAAADKLVKYISKISKKTQQQTKKNNFFSNIGSFASLFDISVFKIKNPVIVASTDGVGTKIEIANQLKKFNTIGIDLVAMCVNDLIVLGAKPIFFLDYISVDTLHFNKVKNILDGIVEGCKKSRCALVGGETAEMPGTYSKSKFDIAGFAVGIAEKRKLLTKIKIKKNDVVLAIPSSGIHSNGYSLVRKILKKKFSPQKNYYTTSNLKKELLKPTKIYVKEINMLVKKNLINGCANITGGGLLNNLTRIIPNKYTLNINLSKIKILKIFKWLKSKNINDKEMLNTFNCGVGFCLIANKKNINKIKNIFSKKYRPYEIGYISKKTTRLNVYGTLQW